MECDTIIPRLIWPNQTELMPHFKIQIWQNRSRSGQSPRMALGGCLSHHTCKMKSCAPPGMHGTCVIHHIRHYQSFNDGFSSTPMLAFLSQSSDFSFSPSQIINSLISLHFFWSSLKVREALLWPGGGKSSTQACFASVRNACAKLTQHQTQQRQQRGEVGEWARTEKCTSKHHLPWWLKPASGIITFIDTTDYGVTP